MQESTSREKILKSIRDALADTMRAPFDYEEYANKIYATPSEDEIHEVSFAKALGKVNGKFVYNKNPQELADNLLHLAPHLPAIYCFESNVAKLLNDAGIEYKNQINDH
ncbi:MAG: hypothetical protein ACOCYO_07585 [Bacteroidota bacterium]